jgi:hypothetical protein
LKFLNQVVGSFASWYDSYHFLQNAKYEIEQY